MSDKHLDKNKASKNIDESMLNILKHSEDLKFEGKHQEAIQIAEEVLGQVPNCVAALEEVADNYLSLELYDKARKAAEHALKHDKISYTAYYILGFIASHYQKWTEAKEYLAKANEIYPDNPEILRCLGWVVYNEGQNTTGLVTLERALNLDPENSLILCDLGVCYMQSRNFEKALSLFYKTLEIDPENQRAKDCVMAAQGVHTRFQDNQKNLA